MKFLKWIRLILLLLAISMLIGCTTTAMQTGGSFSATMYSGNLNLGG